jgi:hypothetical protein
MATGLLPRRRPAAIDTIGSPFQAADAARLVAAAATSTDAVDALRSAAASAATLQATTASGGVSGRSHDQVPKLSVALVLNTVRVPL